VGLFSSRNRGENNSPEAEAESTSAEPSDDGQEAKSSAWTTRSVTGGGPAGGSANDATASDTAAQSKSRTGAGEANTEAASTAPAADAHSTRGSDTKHTSKGSQGDTSMATMGQSIVFKGELTGDEDLEIEGQVDGVVQLANHQLTIGANGRLKAEVHAKSIVVIGQVEGNLTATERIEIQATGVVSGDLKAPRLNVQEGAVLNGSIEMAGGASASAAKKPSASTSPSSASPPNPAGGGAHPAA